MDNIFQNINNLESKSSPYLNREEIFSLVKEEEVFKLVFGYEPSEGSVTCSPFRADTNPSCYFERSPYSGKLLFIDWGDSFRTHNDCVDCIQRYYNLKNYYSSLAFIKEALINNKKFTLKHSPLSFSGNLKSEKKETIIKIKSRAFTLLDKYYWEKYGITKDNLLSDKVFSVNRYLIENEKGSNVYEVNNKTLCYCFSDFDNNKMKLYFPYSKIRFKTNCSNNDVGGVRNLDYSDKQIVITKSYKDYRVLKNLGYNSIWTQSETNHPNSEFLSLLTSIFSDIIIFFDNDITGIKGSSILKEKIEALNGQAYSLYLPEYLLQENIKDASDLYSKKGKEELINFLNSSI